MGFDRFEILFKTQDGFGVSSGIALCSPSLPTPIIYKINLIFIFLFLIYR